MLSLFLLFACTEKSSEQSNEEQREENYISPSEGIWIIPVGEYNQTDSCVDDPSSEPYIDIELSLSANGNGGYTAIFDETIEASCSQEGNELSCSGRSEDAFDDNTTIIQENSFVATLSSSSEMAGTIQLNLDCEGEGCSSLSAWYPTLPCGMNGAFTASFVESIPE